MRCPAFEGVFRIDARDSVGVLVEIEEAPFFPALRIHRGDSLVVARNGSRLVDTLAAGRYVLSVRNLDSEEEFTARRGFGADSVLLRLAAGGSQRPNAARALLDTTGAYEVHLSLLTGHVEKRLRAQQQIAQAVNLARSKELDAALRVFNRIDPAFQDSGDAYQYNALCWHGSLEGASYARRVLRFCDRAVALAPQSLNIRDSRALARGLLGHREGALEDLRTLLADSAVSSFFTSAELPLRIKWVSKLEQGGMLGEEELREARALETSVAPVLVDTTMVEPSR